MPKAVPVDYQSSVKKPDDFDAFWDGVQQQVAAIPLEPEMIPDPLRTSEDVEVFQVYYTSLEHVRIAAWYCRPTRRAERIPGILLLPGYQAEPPIPKEWARRGYGALSVAPRGKLRSHRQFNPGYPNLLTYNIVDRHTYTYRGFYVDCLAWYRFFVIMPRNRSDAPWRHRQQSGWRPDHHHGGHAPGNTRCRRGSTVSVWLYGCHCPDAYLSL